MNKRAKLERAIVEDYTSASSVYLVHFSHLHDCYDPYLTTKTLVFYDFEDAKLQANEWFNEAVDKFLLPAGLSTTMEQIQEIYSGPADEQWEYCNRAASNYGGQIWCVVLDDRSQIVYDLPRHSGNEQWRLQKSARQASPSRRLLGVRSVLAFLCVSPLPKHLNQIIGRLVLRECSLSLLVGRGPPPPRLACDPISLSCYIIYFRAFQATYDSCILQDVLCCFEEETALLTAKEMFMEGLDRAWPPDFASCLETRPLNLETIESFPGGEELVRLWCDASGSGSLAGTGGPRGPALCTVTRVCGGKTSEIYVLPRDA